ncbi:MAG: 3-hydroxyacyl-CoA dehydrogenase family protein [Gemmatimonadetes bacterium]|nr:3-hydroxyacyl-CoA dehydrogenase family protein [Gemmatimonadota bacterium]
MAREAAGSGVPRSERVAVLGAGTMGHGIAQVAAMAGYGVTLHDTSPDALARGLERTADNLATGVALGKVTAEARAAALDRVEGASSLKEAVAGAAIVIEAVPESLALKHRVFRDVERAAPTNALLATNTSGLSITEIAVALGRPGRFLGLHFFNPAHLMALVEVVRGRDTEEATVDRALAFVRQLGKEPIVVNDSPGFASSRLGLLLGLEAMRMVEEGVAEPEAIDRAMELGYRHPMGPLRLSDLVGLDVRLGIAEYLQAKLGERFRPPEILRRMVAEGRLGKKTGSGFYRW